MREEVKYIKDYASKPSGAIQGMVKGLRKGLDPKENFEVDMGRFVNVLDVPNSRTENDPGSCYGCAATCAIVGITGMRWPIPSDLLDREVEDDEAGVDCHVHDNLGSVFLAKREFHPPGFPPLDSEDVNEFEQAIDELRKGHIEYLCKYYFPENPEEEREAERAIKRLIREIFPFGLPLLIYNDRSGNRCCDTTAYDLLDEEEKIEEADLTWGDFIFYWEKLGEKLEAEGL